MCLGLQGHPWLQVHLVHRGLPLLLGPHEQGLRLVRQENSEAVRRNCVFSKMWKLLRTRFDLMSSLHYHTLFFHSQKQEMRWKLLHMSTDSKLWSRS